MKGRRIGSRLRWQLRHSLMHKNRRLTPLVPWLWTMLSLTIRRSP